MKLALFDFDGTITTKDTFIQFIFFTHGAVKTVLASLLLTPAITGYLFKILPRERLKEMFLTSFYHNLPERKFHELATQFVKEALPPMIKEKALKTIQWHQEQGHHVVIVSASPQDYIKIWAQEKKIEVIATRLAVENGRITGLLASKNCYGEEKVSRLKEKHDLSKYEYIYAYGDSRGDLALKQIAHEFHYRIF